MCASSPFATHACHTYHTTHTRKSARLKHAHNLQVEGAVLVFAIDSCAMRPASACSSAAAEMLPPPPLTITAMATRPNATAAIIAGMRIIFLELLLARSLRSGAMARQSPLMAGSPYAIFLEKENACNCKNKDNKCQHLPRAVLLSTASSTRSPP
jgi:hypothetical protein